MTTTVTELPCLTYGVQSRGVTVIGGVTVIQVSVEIYS